MHHECTSKPGRSFDRCRRVSPFAPRESWHYRSASPLPNGALRKGPFAVQYLPQPRVTLGNACAWWRTIVPSIKVQFDYLDHELFKAKLPTLLQSKDQPSVFHSWGGGVMLEQIQTGVCQDITNAIAGDFKDSFYPTGVHAFMSQGKSYGLPDRSSGIIRSYARKRALIQSGSNTGRICSMLSKSARAAHEALF
jgi:hypothetical protein